ncbi:hypothetical protein [Methanimicrococcus hongohii]|nr:hypothetical protein [Methanimicrococcus sp. Hf6]
MFVSGGREVFVSCGSQVSVCRCCRQTCSRAAARRRANCTNFKK